MNGLHKHDYIGNCEMCAGCWGLSFSTTGECTVSHCEEFWWICYDDLLLKPLLIVLIFPSTTRMHYGKPLFYYGLSILLHSSYTTISLFLPCGHLTASPNSYGALMNTSVVEVSCSEMLLLCMSFQGKDEKTTGKLYYHIVQASNWQFVSIDNPVLLL